MNNLVTVTCNLERHMMLLQAESIQKFLAPCKHYVVINEEKVNLEAWRNYLSPYYDRHELILLSQRDLFINDDPKLGGTHTQQVCKLEISKLIRDDYLILDTKNFFIKPTSIKEWKRYMGSTGIRYLDESMFTTDIQKLKQDKVFIDAIKAYAQRLGFVKLPPYYLTPMTPFKVDYDYLSKCKVDSFKNYILKDINGNSLSAPSEFILYSFLVHYYISPEHHTIKDHDLQKTSCAFYQNFELFIEELMNGTIYNHLEYSNIKVWGIHRLLLEKLDPSHIKKINEYLKQKGFNYQFL